MIGIPGPELSLDWNPRAALKRPQVRKDKTMRLSKRGQGGTYQVRFTLPDGSVVRQTTGERDERTARGKAKAMVEAATQRWVRKDAAGNSGDGYTFEDACERYAKVRLHKRLTVDTYEKDGAHIRYLAAATDGEGRPFFKGVPLALISGATILDYVNQELARGLTPETINGRLSTLRGILRLAAKGTGTDGRPLIAAVPEIERLPPSRSPGGWGRALTMDEWERIRLNLPCTGETASCMATGKRGCGRGASVDQRGWAEICIITAMHTRDVNTFCPEHVNLSDFHVTRTIPDLFPGPIEMPPWSFIWRNSKNRARTRGRIAPAVRLMSEELRAVLERLRLVRGFREGIPVAGHWIESNMNRDMWKACKRAGVAPVIDERGREHWLSPNDLRRTSATFLAESFVSDPEAATANGKTAIEEIAEHLGQTDTKVARTIYDRARGARLASVTQRLNRIWGARKGPKPAEPPPKPAQFIPVRKAK